MIRTIKTCAGIGDSIWLFQKLINQAEKFNWQLPDNKPQRGKQIFELMPQLTVSCEYVSGLGYKKIKQSNIQNVKRNWWSIKEKDFVLSANVHLEDGRRIEEFLPDLPTSFILPYETNENQKVRASEMLVSGKLIGIYTSAYSTQRNWGFWDENGWFELISSLRDTGAIFVIIGAQWDTDLSSKLMDKLTEASVPFINTVGQPLPIVLEVLKQLDAFIGFPSGLSILNETAGCKRTLMFYPPVLNLMINSWANPERIRSGEYKGCLFCSPGRIYDWIKTEWRDLW